MIAPDDSRAHLLSGDAPFMDKILQPQHLSHYDVKRMLNNWNQG